MTEENGVPGKQSFILKSLLQAPPTQDLSKPKHHGEICFGTT